MIYQKMENTHNENSPYFFSLAMLGNVLSYLTKDNVLFCLTAVVSVMAIVNYYYSIKKNKKISKDDNDD
jgi:hypothetical protein